MNVTIHDTTAQSGARVFAGVQIQGDYVAGEASLQDRITKWLDIAFSPYTVHNDLRNKSTPGTGEIFLNTQYQEWIASGSKLLWLHGEAGSGKTFLSSLIIDHTPHILHGHDNGKEGKHTVAFFYCSFQESATHIAVNFLKSVNAQIFVGHRPFKELKDLHEKHGSLGSASQFDLCTALAAVATNPDLETADQDTSTQNTSSSTITIVLDGLDEVPSGELQKQYFDVIEALAKLQASQLRIIVVSRFQTVIKNRLKATLGWKCMRRTVDDVESDIDIFNGSQISQNEILQGLDTKLKKIIRSELGQGRPGMLRLAALQMQELIDLTQFYDMSGDLTKDKIEAALAEMPRELNLFYDRIVRRIQPRFRKQLEVALQWIALKSRPLYVEEVTAACAIEWNRAGRLSIGKDIVDVKIILDNLRDMVELRPSPPPYDSLLNLPTKKYTLQFVHQTVQEYLFPENEDRLTKKDGIQSEATSAHKHLTQCCLFYLSHCARHQQGRSSKFALREYAWYSWSMHFICSIDPGASTARPTLESMRLQNSIIHPGLYKSDEDPGNRNSEVIAKFDEFIRFLDTAAQTALKGAIRDTTFPGTTPEQNWDWNSMLSLTGEHSRFFRLVILHPSTDSGSKIVCSLLTDCLDNNPEYEALTWTWGRNWDGYSIQVNGCRFWVTPNLLSCLQCMRHDTERRVLWIDSVTINMRNSAEQNQHVTTMANIYNRAISSAIYIGDWDEYDNGAISQLLDWSPEYRESLIIEAMDTSTPVARWVRYILTRPLWKRIWVVQEIAAAREAICYVGPRMIRWEVLSDVMNHYGRFRFNGSMSSNIQEPEDQQKLEEQLVLGETPSRSYEYPAESDELLRGFKAFQNIGTIARRHLTHSWIPLPQLLWMTRLHEASVWVDKVYALRHFLRPEERDHPLLSVDYTLNTSEVYARLATYIINTYRNLDILSFSTAWEQSPWMPITFGGSVLCPGIFNPEEPEIYNAGGRKVREFSISPDHKTLSVQGICIGKIKHIIPYKPYKLTHLTYENLEVAETWDKIFRENDVDPSCISGYYKDPAVFAETCWRTYCADRYFNSDGLSERIPKHVKQLEPGHYSPTQWQRHGLLDKCLAVLDQRKLALVPLDAKRGDKIVVLFGAMVPFVIQTRMCISSDPDYEPGYRLLGECYVHGYMDGEMVRAHDAGKCKSQMYRLI